jgi:hypothetical protein
MMLEALEIPECFFLVEDGGFGIVGRRLCD